MTTNGFDHLYIETHNWGKAVAFWQRLGFTLDPLATDVYLRAPANFAAPDGIDVVNPFVETHWGTKVMVIQDPDGQRFRIQVPIAPE